MSWKDRAEAYKSIGSAAGQRDDDFVARKILRGLGWSENSLPSMCRKLGIDWDGSVPTLSLAKDCLDAVSGGAFNFMSPSRTFLLDVRPLNSKGLCWKDDDELDEFCEMSKTARGGMIVMGRKKAAQNVSEAVAICFLPDAEMTPVWMLQPPAFLKTKRNSTAVWIRPAENVVRDMALYLNWDVPDRK